MSRRTEAVVHRGMSTCTQRGPPKYKEIEAMATVPTREPVSASPAETLEQRFRRLEALWTAATGHLSSTSKIINHPAIQEVLTLGPKVIPLMLRDLEVRPRLWVWALPQITGVDPIPESDYGNIAKMSQTWLGWAKENGYTW
jgi:hypothetical protein